MRINTELSQIFARFFLEEKSKLPTNIKADPKIVEALRSFGELCFFKGGAESLKLIKENNGRN